jgi:alpha-ketoglutarate-dependent taurine dioxygenase
VNLIEDIAKLSERRRELLELMLGEESLDACSLPLVPRRQDRDPCPLSFAQQRLWFLDHLEGGTLAYNIHVALRFRGVLDVAALELTLSEIVKRQEVLRTIFPAVDGRPMQVVLPAEPQHLPVIDLSTLPRDEREEQLKLMAGDESRQRFDLTGSPPLSIRLLRLGEAEHALLFTMHHIITDAWSMGVLIKEVTTLYKAFSRKEQPSLPKLPIQYADFALWQRQWLQGRALAKQLEYWRRHCGENPPPLNLPTDRRRPAVQTFQGATETVLLPQSIADELKAICLREDATLFMGLLATFQVLLHYYTGQREIVVGTDVANRNRAETEGLIGFFINQLVLRTELSESLTFKELLGRVREVTLGAYAHQDLPFDKLVEALNPERDISRNPLFQVKIILQNAPSQPLELRGLEASRIDFGFEAAHSDLTLYLSDTGAGLTCWIEYVTDLFNRSTIVKMLAHLELLLAGIITDPDARISALAESLRQKDRQDKIMNNRERAKASIKNLITARPKAINLSEDTLVQADYLQAGETLPFVLRATTTDINALAWCERERNFIQEQLSKVGAILFRNFNVRTVAEFSTFARVMCDELLDYHEGSTPRSLVEGKVYTSTEYPNNQYIPLHNEMSYSRSWPTKLWFFCLTPAAEGGETPIADSRKVFQMLDPEIKESFMRKKVSYVRNYGQGFDLTWQQAFQTESREAVEKYCRHSFVEYEWLDAGERLRTRQVCQAVLKHPRTGEWVWFNQAHLFHISNLGPALAEELLSIFNEEELPRNAYYGDGSPIEIEVLDEIRRIYREAEVVFRWQRGDILMVDNMLVAHGRMPYEGERKVVVAMADSFFNKDLTAASI